MVGTEQIVKTCVRIAFRQRAILKVVVSGTARMASGAKDAMLIVATTAPNHIVISKGSVLHVKEELGAFHVINRVHIAVRTIYVKT